MDLEKERLEFLEKFLKNVPFDGWTSECLEKTSISLGKDKYYGRILFAGGASDIIKFFGLFIDQKMEKALIDNPITEHRVRDKIHFLIMTRFKCYTPYKEAIRKLVKNNYTPSNLSNSLKMLWKTSDDFWYKAGDISTDYNYYTKRFLLSCVYSSSLLHWLSDDSKGNDSNSSFVTKEIAKILKLGNIKGHFEKINEKISKIPFLRLIIKNRKT